MVHWLIRIRYQTIEFGDLDIHVRSLRDAQETQEDDSPPIHDISPGNWSIFGVLWKSGKTLAKLMHTYDIKDRRILEVGCGLGLASLVLNHLSADISATDYHPDAQSFLDENTRLNGDPKIPFSRAHWEQEDCGLGNFDLIIGSDLLYERGRAELLSTFIDNQAHPKCEVIMVDPGRGQIARFSQQMKQRGYSDRKLPTNQDNQKEQVHIYTRG